MVKGMQIQGYREDKAESQIALEFQRFSEVLPGVGEILGG